MSVDTNYVSREEIEAMLLAKAVEDPAFAARLKADAKAALSEMFETKLPASLTVHVFQETPTDLMIRLPVVVDDDISEQELEGVAGGVGTPRRIVIRPGSRPIVPGDGRRPGPRRPHGGVSNH